MNEINKTLFIPLYGKALVSRMGIILRDPKAEEIWEKEGFPLKGKAKSKWLAYYMGMRSAVFDNWLKEKMDQNPDALILHIGCGMDSRIHRVGNGSHTWYDIDFPDVIEQRKKYYDQVPGYHMLGADASQTDWLDALPENPRAIVVMEGISMYLKNQELKSLLQALTNRFPGMHLLMDCYTTFAAKASKYKNPINEVGVTTVYGLDDPGILENARLTYLCEHKITPQHLIDQLRGFEKVFFKKMYAGSMAHKLYRLYEFHEQEETK